MNNQKVKVAYEVGDIPTYIPCEDIWAVKTKYGVESGDIEYVCSEFAETGLIYHMNNSNYPNPKEPNHVHGFSGVLETLLDDPECFSIEHFQDEYSAQEREMLEKVQIRLLQKKGYTLFGNV